ncbi:hypothetical protein QUW40_07215 [Collinsella tanakaei]|nr:hypothetical protein [Collinsella tanakaei]
MSFLNSIIKNLLTAFAAQGVSLLVSASMSLLVPKVMGVEDYGFWQLFIFYLGYSGLMLLGLNDGVYLLEGGKTRETIDKRSLSGQFCGALVLQIGMSAALLVGSSALASSNERAFVVSAVAVYALLNNISAFIGYIFQALNETRLFSKSIMIDRGVFLVLLLLSFGFRVSDYRIYITMYIVGKAVCLAYCLFHGYTLVNSRVQSIRAILSDCIHSIKVGFALTISNIMGSLVLGISRLLIDSGWGIVEFGYTSLALSLVSFFTVFVSQVAMVLFPALRQCNTAVQANIYRSMRNGIEIVFPAAYLLYFPIVAILSLWLPMYSTSFKLFGVLLPLCVFDAKQNICSATYLKVLREERLLLIINIATVGLSLLLSLLGMSAFHSIEMTLLGAVAAIVVRSLVSDWYLSRRMRVGQASLPAAEVLLTAVFIVTFDAVSPVLAALLYAASYGLYLLYFRQDLMELVDSMRRILLRR